MKNKIGIVIPVYNGLVFLKKSLPGIIRQINLIVEWQFVIIIADDNSSDGIAAWLNDHYPSVIVLKGNGSLWWSGGTNMGVKYALNDKAFKYILLWNHDILCDENYFKILTERIPEVGTNQMIASKILFLHQPDIIFNMGAFFNYRTGKKKLNGYGLKDSETFNHPLQVDWTGGMGTLIPVETFRTIGLFDEKNFPQYCGDADFFLRAKEKGNRLIVLPELKIWNDKSSSGIERPKTWKLFFRSLFSIKSNYNIFIDFKFLKRYCRSFIWPIYYLKKIVEYFAVFLKNWIRNKF